MTQEDGRRPLSHVTALTLLGRAVAKCEALGQAGTFVVVDASGAPVSTARMDGCAPGALPLVRAKAFGTAVNGEPSQRFAARMAKFGPGIFASYQAVMRDQPFPGAGGVPIMRGDRIVGAIASGLNIGPFVKLPGVEPSALVADGRPANLEDVIISYARGVAYDPQHGDDLPRWIEAYGAPPDSNLKGTAMDEVPPASGQFGLDRARAIADHAADLAAERGQRVSVAVVDALGDVVTLDRTDGAAPMGVDIAAATAVAAVNFGVASAEIASDKHYAGALKQLMDVVPYRMLALPGAYLIRSEADVTGAIGVHCQDLDAAHEIAQTTAQWSASRSERGTP